MVSIGYARVSTTGQTLDAQLEQLTAAGCDRLFRETGSGADRERRELRRALAALQAGDVLTVTRLDRLARSTLDLLDTIAGVQAKGAAFRSLAEAWADTTTPMSRFLLTVMGGLAEFERHLINERTGAGRARAKEQGVRFGRKPKLSPYQKREALKRRDEDREPHGAIARSYGVNRSTITRLRP